MKLLYSIDECTCPSNFFPLLQDYMEDESTPDFITEDQSIKNIYTIFKLRDQYYEDLQSDSYKITQLQSNSMQQLDYNHTMSDIIEDLTTRIANLDPINSSSFKETLLILLAVVATPDINQ